MTRAFIALACTFLLACPAALSRDVFFDIQDPHPLLHEQLAPYCKNARIQVEKIWDQVDPHLGNSVEMVIMLGPDGTIQDLQPRHIDPNPLIERATYAVVNCGGFAPLPNGQNGLCIIAKFKSKRSSAPGDGQPSLSDALLAAGLLAATGFAIYALIKASKKSSNDSGQVNPNYHYVRPYIRADGVYIPGHYQTNPNDTILDNYSTRGNVNIWTGQPGWINP